MMHTYMRMRDKTQSTDSLEVTTWGATSSVWQTTYSALRQRRTTEHLRIYEVVTWLPAFFAIRAARPNI